jgi:hypothetical protein
LGLAIRNIGTQFSTYNGVREKLPLEIIAGVSQELENVPIRWHLTLENLQQWNMHFQIQLELLLHLMESTEEVSFVNNALRHVIVGWSFSQKKHLICDWDIIFEEQKNYGWKSSVIFRDFLGFGLKLNKLKFNYSYSRYTLAGNTSLFLTINFQE